jgi:trk system potassium uptake protein TrkH
LIVLGGLGFYVLEELRRVGIAWKRKKRYRLTLHTRIVLSTTVVLIAGGAVVIFVLERLSSHLAQPWYAQILPAVFQSVTTRTAGFNTVDISQLTNGTLSVMLLLMFVGASPGGTGGGIKTTTFAILVALVIGRVRGRADVEVAERRIPPSLVTKALAVTLIFLAAIVLCTLLLQVSELGGEPHPEVRGRFLELTFETVSAFGTVGLSLGATPTLSTVGKFIIIAAMFAGRLGPLAFALTLVGERRGLPYRYAEERLMIG